MQNVAYAPHFVSIVVTVAILNSMFAPSTGVIRTMLMRLGLIEGYLELLQSADAFKHLYVWSGVWQNLGWDSIIYLSALAGVDVALHESAMIDGASKFKRILHIDLPSILPTVIILLILRVGAMMSVGYEKAYLMQNALNLGASEIISTYVYKQGIGQGNWSYATAVGLFNSVINFVMLTLVNALARRFSEHSLW